MGLPRLSRLDRNFIINGNFDFWQRAITGVSGYVADRFRPSVLVVSNYQQDQDSDIPYGSGYSLKVSATNTEVKASGTVFGMTQIIEGNFAKDLKEQKITFTFYVKANHTGTYTANIIGNQSYVSEFTINTANQWQRVDITTELPPNLFFDESTGIGFSIVFELLSNPDNETATLETWTGSGTTRGSSTQDNFFSSASNEIKFSKVMITIGEPKEDGVYIGAGSDHDEELRLCKRYFEKIRVFGSSYFAQYTNPGTPTFYGQFQPFEVEKRVVPSSSFDSLGNNHLWTWVFQTAYSAPSNSGIGLSSTVNGWRLQQPRVAGGGTPTLGNMYSLEADFDVLSNAEF